MKTKHGLVSLVVLANAVELVSEVVRLLATDADGAVNDTYAGDNDAIKSLTVAQFQKALQPYTGAQ